LQSATKRYLLILALALTASAGTARSAEDAYCRVQVGLPRPGTAIDFRTQHLISDVQPRVVVRDGEGYVHPDIEWAAWNPKPPEKLDLMVRAPSGLDVTGTLYLPHAPSGKVLSVPFTIKSASTGADDKSVFLRAKRKHYLQMLSQPIPGSAWYRSQVREANLALDGKSGHINDASGNWPSHTLDETFDLFNGGRALSENLQLDRVLPAGRQAEEATVPLQSIPGITVREMDFKSRLGDAAPQLDPLSPFIPADQHAIFFPTFDAAMQVLDEADQSGVPILHLFEPRSEDAGAKHRYQRQLCLSLTGIGRLLGPKVIGSVAVTGSDAYLRTGSDVAVIFEARDPQSLQVLLASQIALARRVEPAAAAVEGKVLGVSYSGARSHDRSVCTYVARLGDTSAVVVTNSLAQLERIIQAQSGQTPALAGAAEYAFFRQRYARGEESESAFLMLTDATIRRWCSPRWRIADARRTQAAAVLADLQAAHADQLVSGRVEVRRLDVVHPIVDPGLVGLTPTGVASATYGTLDFLTPIIELQIDKVTPTEAQLYGRWRDGYQSNWSNFFDPIAARMSITTGEKPSLSLDLSVMPLIGNTDYKELVNITRGVQLQPGAGDPHDAILHLAVAINRDSHLIRQAGEIAKGAVPNLKIDPLAWLGKTAAIYIDDDPFWSEMAKADEAEKFIEQNGYAIPVALYVESDSVLKLTAFVAAVRAYIEETSPGNTAWIPQEYKNGAYVKVGDRHGNEKMHIYYAVTSDALLVTPNENVIRKFLDRQSRRKAAKANGEKLPEDLSRPWPGASLAAVGDHRLLEAASSLLARPYGDKLRKLAWGNLPILNEWKRLYPDKDPVAVHEQLWQVRLLDPAGGRYVWNEAYQTMESTTFGHPSEPRQFNGLPAQARDLLRASFGVTFDDDGLRARATVIKKAGERR